MSELNRFLNTISDLSEGISDISDGISDLSGSINRLSDLSRIDLY